MYKFMSFRGTKNTLINGAMILFAIFFILPTVIGYVGKKSSCLCSRSADGGNTLVNGTSTISSTPKYYMPPQLQQQSVARKSIGLFSPRAAV